MYLLCVYVCFVEEQWREEIVVIVFIECCVQEIIVDVLVFVLVGLGIVDDFKWCEVGIQYVVVGFVVVDLQDVFVYGYQGVR